MADTQEQVWIYRYDDTAEGCAVSGTPDRVCAMAVSQKRDGLHCRTLSVGRDTDEALDMLGRKTLALSPLKCVERSGQAPDLIADERSPNAAAHAFAVIRRINETANRAPCMRQLVLQLGLTGHTR